MAEFDKLLSNECALCGPMLLDQIESAYEGEKEEVDWDIS